jgi:hypothetical protein
VARAAEFLVGRDDQAAGNQNDGRADGEQRLRKRGEAREHVEEFHE